ncbi:DUF3857 domain-containing protein [Mucilaginibacter sp. McL0603]|uniref:DUF3857 domain-containing protein n=1 Tax=Mucilaginibacter sp. McL0603 TaxID=3415670 RepID=UPI003CEB8A82
MNKLFTLLLLGAVSLTANAQTAPTPATQPFGKVDQSDLEMKTCDFEKDANAEVLFDKGTVSFTVNYDLVFERHVRIKIFNEKGKDQANVKIDYWGGGGLENMSRVQAETINLNDGKIEIIKVDKKSIYTQTVDKQRSALVFSFPNVQPGSIIEFKYTLMTESIDDFPDWYFQDRIPTRYSELNTSIPGVLTYKNLVMVNMPFVKNTPDVKAMSNIPSLPDEPYMGARHDNYQRILYQLLSINAGANSKTYSDTWKKIGENEVGFDDFGGEFNRKLTGEDAIISKAKSLSSQDAKIAYVFDEVKKNMKWNEVDVRYTNDGTQKAWDKKIGNSTEINLILYHLLHKVGVTGYPTLVSTKKNGKVNPAYPSRYQFNRTVVYIPIDTARYYLLDATNKYNSYKDVPETLLNSFGLSINKEDKKYDLVFLQKTDPVRYVALINAEIKPGGKMNGTAQLNNFSYDRAYAIEKYKTDGEKKYIDYLRNDDNNLKISSIKFDNMDVDTLALTQNLDFDLDLTGSDENYIYFNPNLFTTLETNQFINENRHTDIDFGYKSNYSINGVYKIPAGYKIDAMPKPITMTMPDNSIIFRRIVGEQDGSVVIRFSVNYNKSLYFKETYPELHEFFKKMHEMLNEQIILKKS